LRINGRFRKSDLKCNSTKNLWMDLDGNEIGLNGDEVLKADCVQPCMTNLAASELSYVLLFRGRINSLQ
ncbi:hypothetical protein PFISCL1PPCAC_24966, partial [Pristionchus fissidentatus]